MARRRKKRRVEDVAGDEFPGGIPETSALIDDRRKYVEAAGELPKGWDQAADVLDIVTCVRTCLLDFNSKVKVGGLPIRRIHTIHGPTHGGKSQRLDEPVLTPSGWVAIGNLKVGDDVTGRDGRPTCVIGVYPQGVRPIYEVEFSDGAMTRCCAEHLWFTTTKKERFRGMFTRGPRPERIRIPTGLEGSGSVKALADIMKDPPYTHEIPLVDPVEFAPTADLSLQPYLLGLLLGDGGLSVNSLMFHKPEEDLRACVREMLLGDDDAVDVDRVTIRIRGGATKKAITDLGLYGCRAWEKFVPDRYLRASPESRLALLRGLFDTDGHVVRKGERVEYTTTSPRLANDVVDLVRGLGGIASITWRTTSYTSNGEKKLGRPSARINAWFTNGIVPVASEKHLAKWDPSRRDRVRRSIVKVTPAGEAECVCIAVDAPDHLYVTRDYIVTHNTAFVLALVKSFVDRGFLGAYADAEHSLDGKFAAEVVAELRTRPSFLATRPKSYETMISAADTFLTKAAAVKTKYEDAKSIMVVDSINKLVPERELAKLLKADGAKELAKGHHGMLRAALNQAWLDKMTPQVAKSDCALVLIAQEREEQSDDWTAPEFKVKGGGALTYDASLVIRVMRGEAIFPAGAEKEKKRNDAILGHKHRVRIWKSKVGHMDGRYTDCFFHMSNGKLTPPGLDIGRDALMVGTELGVIKQSSSWFSYKGRRWQGAEKFLTWFYKDEEKSRLLVSDIGDEIDRRAGRLT